MSDPKTQRTLRFIQDADDEEFWHVFLDGMELTDPMEGTDDLDVSGYIMGEVFTSLGVTVEFIEP